MKIEERRREPRTFLKIKVDYKCQGAFLYDFSANLSESGVFIQAENLLKIGEKVKISFILPEVLEKIEATAKVAWVNDKGKNPDLPRGMGLKFSRLSKKKKEYIQDVIDKIEKGKGITPI